MGGKNESGRSQTVMLEFLEEEEYPQAKKFVEETAARVGVKIYK